MMDSTMLLPQTAEYALRAMAWIASRPGGEAVRARDLSEIAGIPPHYVSKVMRRLVVAGLLDSQKGHGGGFVLARPPAEIRFVEVLEAMDAVPDRTVCHFGWGRCNAAEPCPLHSAWIGLCTSFHAWSTQHTLADVHDVPEEVLRVRSPASTVEGA